MLWIAIMILSLGTWMDLGSFAHVLKQPWINWGILGLVLLIL